MLELFVLFGKHLGFLYYVLDPASDMIHLALYVADLLFLLFETADHICIVVYLLTMLRVDLFDQMQEELAFLVELGVLLSHTSVVSSVYFG